jgi:DNA-binding CsgD family transcriptional regulator
MRLKFPWFVILTFASINQLWSQQYQNPFTFSPKAFDSLSVKMRIIRPDSISLLCLSFMHKYNLRKNPKVYQQFCQKLISQIDDKEVLTRIRLLALIDRLKNSNYSKEEINSTFNKEYDKALVKPDLSAALEILFEWARYHERKKDKIETLKILFYGERFAQKNLLEQDISFQAILNLIGYTLWEMDKPVDSNNYFKKSINTKSVLDLETMVAYNAMGINYQKMDSLSLSLDCFEKSTSIAKNNKNQIFQTVVKGNAAHTLYKLQNLDQALKYANEDKEMSISQCLFENAVGALNLMIKIELDQKKYQQAGQSFYDLGKIMENIKPSDYYSLKRYKEAEYLYYEKLKNFDKALSTFKEYKKYDDLFLDVSNRSKISELQLDAEVRIYAQEMEQKERDRKLRNYLLIAVITIFLGVLFLLSKNVYKRFQKIEKEKSRAMDVSNLQAIEIENLRNEIHRLLSSIKDENVKYEADLKNEAEKSNIININDKTESGLQDLEKLKNYNLARHDQWEDFRQLFSKLYPNFETTVKNKLENVSTAELRLMMLHKLGLNTKDIAQILYISIDGVKKSKYRLYKKIGISTSEELDSFLEV